MTDTTLRQSRVEHGDGVGIKLVRHLAGHTVIPNGDLGGSTPSSPDLAKAEHVASPQPLTTRRPHFYWKLLPVSGAVAGGVVGALLGNKAHTALVLLAVALASAVVLLVVLLVAAWGWEK